MEEVEFKLEIPKELEQKMERCGWIDWSKVALKSFSERLEDVEKAELDSEFLVKLFKRDISERYKKTREITDEDWKFCEKIDWHPVDELPMKEEHIKELKKALRETPIGKTYKSAEEFFESLK